MTALLNSFPSSSAEIVGGQYNVVPPAPVDGQFLPIQLDASGFLKVNVVSGGGSNAAAGPTGAAVPADADYQGVNIGGILTGVTGLALGATTKAPTVAIVDGSGNQITSFGGGTQYADSAASGGTPTGTLAMGWDSVNSKIRALKVDLSQNLEVAINAPLPAGTNVIGHVIVDSGAITVSGTVTANQGTAAALAGAWPVEVTDGTNILGTSSHPVRVDPIGTTTQPVSGSVSVSNFPATQNVAGTTTDGSTTETNFLVVGGESNDATAQYQPIPLGASGRSVIIEGVAGGTAVPISGSVSVSNFPATQPVSGTVTANQGSPNTVANSWPVEVTDGTNILGTSSHPLRIDPTGTTTQPISGSVSVSNFPATQNVAGTTTDGSTTEIPFLAVGGETNDATAQYQPIPLGAGGRSVIVEGFTGGTAVPISGTVGVTQSTSPWVDNITQAAGINLTGQVAGSLPVTIVSGTGNIAGVPSASVSVVDSQTVTLVDLMQTLIQETRAMRSAIVYMITENGDILDSDFNPASQDFQPVN